MTKKGAKSPKELHIIDRISIGVPQKKMALHLDLCTSRTFLLECPRSEQETCICKHMVAILQGILRSLTFSRWLLQTFYEPSL